MLLEAVRQMTTNAAFWNERGGYKHPVFLDNSTTNVSRIASWRTFGALCGLFIARLGVGPLPVSPFLIATALLSLFGPDEDFSFAYLDDVHPSIVGNNSRYIADVIIPLTNLPTLVALDPELAAQFEPWISLQWNDPIPSNMVHPAAQFVILVLERNVSVYILSVAPWT